MTPQNSNDLIRSALVAEDASFADLVEEFLVGLDERLGAMKNALDGNDFDTLRTLAHQLRGAGGGHGYPVLTEKSARLEQQAIAKQVESCTRMVDELLAIRPRIVVALP